MADATLDVRLLDEWIYALNFVAESLEADSDAHALLLKTLDAMREQRAQLRLERHNVTGY